MNFFVQYVNKRRRYLLLLVLFVLIYAVTFALYRLPLAAVWYPAALSLLVGCVVMAIDYRRVRAKYLYIHDDAIVGNVNNDKTGTANGITYNNKAYVLRYVIGV